ncbi:hypothetical protein [Bradyrhizobium sp. USDA 4473]
MTDPHTPETFERCDGFWHFRFQSLRRTRFIRSENSERFLRAISDTCSDPVVQLKRDRYYVGYSWDMTGNSKDK